jgi:prepilin-type N-terminal cleavage/methylation domain-containing protein
MKRISNYALGFTLVELMIAIAVVSILAAVAIPAYLNYLRQSYLSEATSSISSIKSAEESYFSINGCYVAAAPWPAAVPVGCSVAWDPVTLDPNPWGRTGLSVRPDRRVRFQYAVYATNSLTTTSACAPAADTGTSWGNLNSRAQGVGCVPNLSTNLVPASIFPTNWYVVVARGDLSGDGVSSNIISAIDDSSIIKCNEME